MPDACLGYIPMCFWWVTELTLSLCAGHVPRGGDEMQVFVGKQNDGHADGPPSASRKTSDHGVPIQEPDSD